MEKISILLDKALDISSQGEHSLLPLLSQCQSVLEELASFAPSFGEFRSGLEESLILIRDLADSLVRFKDRRTESPDNLEAIEERLSLIEKLKRKHDGSLEAVLERVEGMKEERRALETSQERLASLQTEIDKAFLHYADTAQKLGSLRAAKAGELGRLIEKEIALLGMSKAKFEVRISSCRPDLNNPETVRETGTEKAEFVISPNPGEDMKPLRKIASGGELSRIMLALKVVGEETEGRKTLIFDEIDAGIGGKTADFIAQKLRTLALRHQVLCITHLPQIASAAAHHYRVDKTIEKDRTYTSIDELDRKERMTELARLISGRRVTQASLETAKEMLEAYQQSRKKK
jgi:DNA repair protein RecN (Recombination protein N)